ncbi:MAG: DNA-binding protein [Bacilli bacterium]|nr:DNA-binding protein [Bacilli bacterium]
MEDIVYYSELYDIYGGLLTEKQKKYFEDYYFHNLSFAEMAEAYEVSRNAAFKQIHIVLDKLCEYEKILQLKEKREKILSLVKDSKLQKELEEILYK